ncbi:hypothetical protein PX52LOC_05927 [Limnoglobus roseus]|uniref:Uncharacterized protein n=1 Tax=Limnoglobus roseus TaxID=2598579 RepID=A0A5C1ANU1_9BACT|nr:hypothetical protein PX52LOC_05927 [Limnoglobus roseus]
MLRLSRIVFQNTDETWAARILRGLHASSGGGHSTGAACSRSQIHYAMMHHPNRPATTTGTWPSNPAHAVPSGASLLATLDEDGWTPTA